MDTLQKFNLTPKDLETAINFGRGHGYFDAQRGVDDVEKALHVCASYFGALDSLTNSVRDCYETSQFRRYYKKAQDRYFYDSKPKYHYTEEIRKVKHDIAVAKEKREAAKLAKK